MSGYAYLSPSPVEPQSLTITAITTSNPAIVTVEEANNYIAKQLVCFSVPNDYGMFQINGKTAEILEIDGQNFTVSIDATQFDPFVTPLTGEKPAMLSPAGSRNLYNFTTVPFHAENGMQGN